MHVSQQFQWFIRAQDNAAASVAMRHISITTKDPFQWHSWRIRAESSGQKNPMRSRFRHGFFWSPSPITIPSNVMVSVPMRSARTTRKAKCPRRRRPMTYLRMQLSMTKTPTVRLSPLFCFRARAPLQKFRSWPRPQVDCFFGQVRTGLRSQHRIDARTHRILPLDILDNFDGPLPSRNPTRQQCSKTTSWGDPERLLKARNLTRDNLKEARRGTPAEHRATNLSAKCSNLSAKCSFDSGWFSFSESLISIRVFLTRDDCIHFDRVCYVSRKVV